MCGDRLIYDALIAGGSLEGCIAAVELAGRGRKVLLTEENGSLGGMCTNGLEVWLPAESEEEEKVRQYRERILREAGAEEGLSGPLYQDQKLKAVLKKMLDEAGVTALTHIFPEEVGVGESGVSARMAVKTGTLEISSKILLDGTADLELAGAAGLERTAAKSRVSAAVKWNGVSEETWRQRIETVTGEGEGWLTGKMSSGLSMDWKGILFTADHLFCSWSSRFGELIMTGLTADLPELSRFTLSDAQAGLRLFSYRLRDDLRKSGPGMEKVSIIQTAPVMNLYGTRKASGRIYENKLFLMNQETERYSNLEAIRLGIRVAQEAEAALQKMPEAAK